MFSAVWLQQSADNHAGQDSDQPQNHAPDYVGRGLEVKALLDERCESLGEPIYHIPLGWSSTPQSIPSSRSDISHPWRA
jgi:hypothetical protein